jgi:hypothetical protein
LSAKIKVYKRATKGKIKSSKVGAGGYVFDSKLEYYFYKRCKDLGIPVKVKPETFTVLDKFRFHGKAIRAITYTPDFYLPEHQVIIETKGFANDSFPLREKMFLKHLLDTGRKETYQKLKNQKEINEFLDTLLK